MNRRSFVGIGLFSMMLMLLARTAWGIADDVTKDGDVASLASGKQVEFSVITALGWVRFAAADDWAVSSMYTKKPLKTAVFKISGNPSEGNVTGLAVVFYEIGSQDAEAAFSTFHQATTGDKARLDAWHKAVQAVIAFYTPTSLTG